VDALNDLTRQAELEGYAGYVRVQAAAETARRRIANFLHADEEELAFTGNASHSLNIARALPWEKMRSPSGEPAEILISDHEYPTTNQLFRYLEQTGWVRLVRYPLSADTETVLSGLNDSVTAQTRMVVASHVCCNTGLRADVAAISAWCRERGLISFMDGAQAVGQFPIDLTAIGCDLYISNGHKWLFGPNGVGLLYVRSGFAEQLEPSVLATGTIVFAPEGEAVTWQAGAARFESRATRPAQIFAAMNSALEWLDNCGGTAAIEARHRSLTAFFKRRVLEMPDRFRLLTPLSWEQSSALATVQITGRSGREVETFCGRMLTKGAAWLRAVPEFDGLRLSMAYYNTEEEYERFFELLRYEGFG
jgi:L-cysteine/cystine lyase